MEFLSLSRELSPRETSPAARNEEKRLFSQAKRNAISGEVGVTGPLKILQSLSAIIGHFSKASVSKRGEGAKPLI